jgi:hypothetical protein
MPGNIRICPNCNKKIKKRYNYHISYLCPERNKCDICFKYTTWEQMFYSGYKCYYYHISCYEEYTKRNISFKNDIGNIIYKYIHINY